MSRSARLLRASASPAAISLPYRPLARLTSCSLASWPASRLRPSAWPVATARRNSAAASSASPAFRENSGQSVQRFDVPGTGSPAVKCFGLGGLAPFVEPGCQLEQCVNVAGLTGLPVHVIHLVVLTYVQQHAGEVGRRDRVAGVKVERPLQQRHRLLPW